MHHAGICMGWPGLGLYIASCSCVHVQAWRLGGWLYLASVRSTEVDPRPAAGWPLARGWPLETDTVWASHNGGWGIAGAFDAGKLAPCGACSNTLCTSASGCQESWWQGLSGQQVVLSWRGALRVAGVLTNRVSRVRGGCIRSGSSRGYFDQEALEARLEYPLLRCCRHKNGAGHCRAPAGYQHYAELPGELVCPARCSLMLLLLLLM